MVLSDEKATHDGMNDAGETRVGDREPARIPQARLTEG